MDIETIRNELKTFAEENRKEMSVNVYEGLWHTIQSIDHELETSKKVK